MQSVEIRDKRDGYDITDFGYACQVCGYKVETRPPEWCPRCGTHRVIFKKTPLSDNIIARKSLHDSLFLRSRLLLQAPRRQTSAP